MIRATEVYVPNMNINTPMTMIKPSLKKINKGTRPSPSEVKVRIWMKIGKMTARAVQLMEPTSEMKLSSWGILSAKMPAMEQNTNHWFVNTPSVVPYASNICLTPGVSPARRETIANSNWEISKFKSLAIFRNDWGGISNHSCQCVRFLVLNYYHSLHAKIVLTC